MFRVASLSILGLAMVFFCFSPAWAQMQPGPRRAPAPLETLPARAEVLPSLNCAELARRDFSTIPGAPTQVTEARVVAAGTDTGEACRVTGYVAPQVQFQLDMPTHGYTGRYLQAGCRGNCGRIPTGLVPPCANDVARQGGFAMGANDSGHAGDGNTWAADPELRRDFAYRADHVTALAARALLTAYYGSAPAFSYFVGCSDGGREGLQEAQRYPKDFNGVLAGSAAIRIAEAMERFLWQSVKGVAPDGKAIFDAASVKLLHQAVLDACDALDGLKDGQIDDPRRCSFDPGTLQCGPGKKESCLTPQLVQAARDYYSGPVNAHGKHLAWGGEPYGGELNWAGIPPDKQFASGFIRWMVYGGHPPEGMRPEAWRFTAESLDKLATDGADYESRNPDLGLFRDAGGKLILWQGTADSPAGEHSMLAYYQDVRDRMGGLNEVRNFARVYLIPGGYHCFGGYVAYNEDLLGALVNWVEAGKTPDKIVAAAYLPDGTLRTRPVFAYPAAAVYKGSGDINSAESFTSRMPAHEPDDHYDWLGAKYK
jgi:feruloyl esterase